LWFGFIGLKLFNPCVDYTNILNALLIQTGGPDNNCPVKIKNEVKQYGVIN